MKRIEENGEFVELMEANVLNFKYVPKEKEKKKSFKEIFSIKRKKTELIDLIENEVEESILEDK